MLGLLGRWSSPMFLLAGAGLVVGGVALGYMLVFDPVPVVWALPALSMTVGLIAGAGAFVGLHRHLKPHAPRLAAMSTILATLTVGAALVTTTGVLFAATQGSLPGGIVSVSYPVAILGFVATVSMVVIAAFAAGVLPQPAVWALGIATVLTLVLVASVVASGELSPVLLVAVLVLWGLALIGVSRGVPRGA